MPNIDDLRRLVGVLHQQTEDVYCHHQTEMSAWLLRANEDQTEIENLKSRLAERESKRVAIQIENEELKAKLAASRVAERRAVRAAVRAAVLAEREACAKVCSELSAPEACTGIERSLWDVATEACCDAIRARGAP
jgi:regulator of replication initiation timing